MRRATILGWLLLIVAAAARILLQNAAMPPWAGLDEIYHVARLAFVSAEGRNPTTTEMSIPPYLHEALDGASHRPPAFAISRMRWPQLAQRTPFPEEILSTDDLRPYSLPNYQAQHPSFYYSIAAPLLRTVGVRTELSELRAWRMLSLFFALIIVLATGAIGYRCFGPPGLLAAALLVSIPTWQSLVLRAGNDAFACAWIAVALAVTAWAPRRPGGWIAEGITWAGAIAAKLYAWPIAIVLPVFWKLQRARRPRIIIVLLFAAAAAAVTAADLRARTGHIFGLQDFQQTVSAEPRPPVDVDYTGAVKVFIASLIWTSGQHGNALKPVAMALYVLPLLALLAYAWTRPGPTFSKQMTWSVLGAALLTFTAAQAYRLVSYGEKARQAGISMPASGKEGWYVWAMAPLIVGMGLALAITDLQRVRGRARESGQKGASVFHSVALGLLLFWILGWDVLITEGALFHDYAGTSAPAYPSALFRWGPAGPPFSADPGRAGVGPLEGATAALRLIHLAAIAALAVLESNLQGSSSDDRDRHSPVAGR